MGPLRKESFYPRMSVKCEGLVSQAFDPAALLSSLGLLSSGQSLCLSLSPAQTSAWRKQIFQQLTERTRRELENFRHYEQAVEQVKQREASSLEIYI